LEETRREDRSRTDTSRVSGPLVSPQPASELPRTLEREERKRRDGKMNQQPELFFTGYPMNNANRSPGSTRPGYNTTTGLPSAGRMNQRQMDSIGQSGALYAAEDRFGSYDTNAFRHNRIQPTPGFATENFSANSQSWAYNSGANTVNGALGGDGRLRSGARRALPTVRCDLPLSTCSPPLGCV